MIEKYLDKAEHLIEAAPYIQQFSGKTMVIKYGGAAMINEDLEMMVMDNIALLSIMGIRPVIVHGGGPSINSMLERLDITPQFIDGLRVTDEAAMEITEMVLSGAINKRIVSHLNKRNILAVGISGKDGSLFETKLHRPKETDIGLVGDIVSCNPLLIEKLLSSSFIPVISPVSAGKNHPTLNVNADTAALKIAEALGATKLIFLSDVDGILKDINDPSSVISSIKKEEVDTLIKEGIITGGMIPKVTSAAKAVRSGVGSVHILNGKSRHALLLEIFTDKGIGTVIW